jgi:hypothetical protein
MTGTPRTHHDHTSGDPASSQATVTRNTHLDQAGAAQLALLLLGPRPEGDESGGGRDELQASASRARSGPATSPRSPRAEGGPLWDGIHRRDMTWPT